MSKLNLAKENLSKALAELEEAIENKINSKTQSQVAVNFANEINALQKELAEIGGENEELKNFKSSSESFIKSLKTDLAKIKQIIN